MEGVIRVFALIYSYSNNSCGICSGHREGLCDGDASGRGIWFPHTDTGSYGKMIPGARDGAEEDKYKRGRE
ncbi:hypothetical protein RRG08_030502 [Elysia crispata]|uniref:Uncharacterized protein n=1 Tax=Elysia crispata TaxID=231223 RepID=A0AAE0ZR76_9GAST|nr:hypothetical protein RRG08_030502 [Elysia crispata]